MAESTAPAAAAPTVTALTPFIDKFGVPLCWLAAGYVLAILTRKKSV